MKYLNTNTACYEVEINVDNTLTITLNGKPYKNAGMLIVSIGGVDAVIARLEDRKRECVKPPREDHAAEITEARETCRRADASAEALLDALKTLSKYAGGGSPEIGNVLSGENALSRALTACGGSYTFATYDCGETIIKFADGRRFTTKDRNSSLRDAKSIKTILEAPAIHLEPGERCPYCGQIKRKPNTASAENGKKGGRPAGNVNQYEWLNTSTNDDGESSGTVGVIPAITLFSPDGNTEIVKQYELNEELSDRDEWTRMKKQYPAAVNYRGFCVARRDTLEYAEREYKELSRIFR